MLLMVLVLYGGLALQAFVLAVVFVPLARRLGARFGFFDPVGGRKIHDVPIVRCGGIGIYLAFMLALLGNLAIARMPFARTLLPAAIEPYLANIRSVSPKLTGLLAGATILFIVGLIDDRKLLCPRVKLLAQVISAAALTISGVSVKLFLPWPILGDIATIAWVVLLTNAFNFIDNMNGLSAGVAAFCALNCFFISYAGSEFYMMAVFALMIGSLCGFLVFNFPNARIFMGDSGALFIGYMLAGLSILVTYFEAGVPTQLSVVSPLIILGVPIFDTATVLFIRWRLRKPLTQGDQNHFSHRLVALGFTRTGAVLFIWLITLASGLAAVNLRHLDWFGSVLALVQVGLFFLIIYFLERVARRGSE